MWNEEEIDHLLELYPDATLLICDITGTVIAVERTISYGTSEKRTPSGRTVSR